MRLIDADELLKKHTCDVYGAYDDSCMVQAVFVPYIKGAPTVDAVILPCKLGETVYVIRDCSCYGAPDNRKNKRKKCSGKVYLGERLRKYHCGYVSEAKFELKHIADFGKMVFLTRVEAEAALAERMIHNA